MNKYSMIALAVLASAAFSQSALALQMVKSQEVHNDVIVKSSTDVSGEVISHGDGLTAGYTNAGKLFFDLKIDYPTSGIAALGFCSSYTCHAGPLSGTGQWFVYHSNGRDYVFTDLTDKTVLLPADPVNFPGKNLVTPAAGGSMTLSFQVPQSNKQPLLGGTWKIDGFVYTFAN